MKFIAEESPQKLRGGYYTQPDVADFLAGWVLETNPRRLLEPACGDGAFFTAVSHLEHRRLEEIVACEINSAEAMKASECAARVRGRVDIYVGDFLKWYLSRLMAPPDFDAVLGNPPFIRYQYLEPELQGRAEQIFDQHGLAFTKHTNAWVPFVVASLAMLRPGGRLAMVVPAELLHVLHARSLRHFLLGQCSRVLVIDPEGIWFDDTLQGTILLLAEKRGGSDTARPQVAIVPVKHRAALARPASEYFHDADFFPGSVLNGKWMLGLLTKEERQMFEQLGKHPSIRSFVELADVDVGLVTGANKFFLVTDAVVRGYGLEQWAHPMFGRSEHVRGVIYDKKSHRDNRKLGFPSNFLWFGDTRMDELPESARRYIKTGEAQKLHTRYKCRVRTPWYCVPSVYLTPVGMLKRSHHFPRLILNTAKAYTTDTAYRIRPKRTKATNLVLAFVNSLTALSAELEGRHYGGGVLELVPSEIERVLLPEVRQPRSALASLDKAVRAGTAPENLLAAQDSAVLRPLGISKRECEELLAAWSRLRVRRQRTSSAAEEGADD
jgi:adenine-specific DNA methylase